jgi:monoamine oxidase
MSFVRVQPKTLACQISLLPIRYLTLLAISAELDFEAEDALAIDISRRAFIDAIGYTAGATGFQRTLGAMGLLPTPTAFARAPTLPPDHGKSKKVVILGAGIAGLVAAYQLKRAGYECSIIEARSRPGGRVWTLRGGDQIVETMSTQRVIWNDRRHLYFNAGAARISHHHTGLLAYCREFDIPLEVFVSDNRAALLQTEYAFEGKPQQLRRVIMDGRGAIAALAAKAVPSANAELQKLLMAFGHLQPDMTYNGTGWAGYSTPPGGGLQSGVALDPLPIEEIAKAVRDFPDDPRFFNPLLAMIFAEVWDQSPTMLQPVGGMDAISRAFAKRLGSTIQYNMQVTKIERTDNTARIIWRNLINRQTGAIESDFVICTLPLTVLQSIPTDFSPSLKKAVDGGVQCYVPAAKLGLYSKRRWWETDLQLYGGISWTSRDITQIWYPSHGFHEKDGILTGAYLWDSLGKDFSRKTPAQRLVTALEDGERIHPRYSDLVSEGISVAWSNIPFSEGGWCEWTDGPRATYYPILVAGEGPFYFAGEHVSYVQGWQEGAVQSAHETICRIAGVGLSSCTATDNH